MTQVGQDTLGTRSTMTVGGRDIAYYSLAKAGAQLGDISRLPFSMKVLLENLLRFEDGGFTVSTKDIQAIVTRNINAAALLERADVAELGKSLEAQLASKGMKINTVDPAPFRDKLKAAGFYDEWTKKFGDTAWTTLEGAVGSLG